MGKRLRLRNPQRFSEKLNWMKLYDRNPLYTALADKYAVREYIARKIGSEYLIPLLGVWQRPQEIEAAALPDRFVLKCTHDSGSVIRCTDKKTFDWAAARAKLERSFGMNYFYPAREWPYRDIVPRVIAEKYMVDESGTELKDYKIFNFNGEPRYIQVDYDRFVHHERKLYDVRWRDTQIQFEYPYNAQTKIEKPDGLEEMLSLARTLSAGFPFLRTDFYSVNGKVYFGELTFYPEAGFGRFTPERYDEVFGAYIQEMKYRG